MTLPTTDTLSRLSTRITENAARYFPDLSGQRVSARCTPLHPRSPRMLYRCELTTPDRAIPSGEIIVKLAPRSLRIEYDHLTLLTENHDDSKRALRVPRPLDYYADLNALLMEKVGGAPLSRLMLRRLHILSGAATRQAIARWIRLCGQWLAYYHRLTRAADAAPFDGAWLDTVTIKTRELEHLGLPPGTTSRACDTFARLHEVGIQHPAPHAHRHRDFGLQNVHAGDGWICVFDLNDRRVECVYEDLSYFLVTLETINNWPRYPLFDRGAATAMKAECLAGYFGPGAHHSPLLLEGHTLKQLVLRCVRQRRNVATRAPWLAPVFDALYIKRLYPRRLLKQCALLDRLLRSDHPHPEPRRDGRHRA